MLDDRERGLFALPIFNPANLVVFHRGMPPLGQWLALFGVPSVCSIAATFFALRLYFRKDLTACIEEEVRDSQLKPAGKFAVKEKAKVDKKPPPKTASAKKAVAKNK